MDGKGRHTWPDGREFVGIFKKGKHEGLGIFKWPNGDVFEGKWRNGV